MVCRIGDLLRDRGISAKWLSSVSGVSEDTITNLKRQTWNGVERQTLGKLCAALGVPMHELLEAMPADIWWPIRRHRRMTVHLGSASFPAVERHQRAARKRDPSELPYIDRQFIGTWDVRAFFEVYQYLTTTVPGGVQCGFLEHPLGSNGDSVPVNQRLAEGDHIIFGSPITNPFAEDAVCHGFEVDPLSSQSPPNFPYWFRWLNPVLSSLGEVGTDRKMGIVARKKTRLVLPRTIVSEGTGTDCGLIFTYRFPPIQKRQRLNDDDEFIVIAIMGHSGCGTLAGARLICQPDVARALYPPGPRLPVLEPFATSYSRKSGPGGFDNRIVGTPTLLNAKKLLSAMTPAPHAKIRA